jgi:import inner membrane translocase subunit TIM22
MDNNNNKQPRPVAAATAAPYGVMASTMTPYMPFFKQTNLPAPPPEIPLNPALIPESCGSKIIMGAVMGAVLGSGLGLFMGAMGDVSPIEIIQGREVPQAPLREQTRAAFRSVVGKAGGWAKSFGVLSALFGSVECLIEKYRGKHDVWNPVVSGCVVGATLSASGGPAAACMGCGGFAGFSLIIDKVMGTH